MQGFGGRSGTGEPELSSRVSAGDLERERETANSRMEGRTGDRRRPENHPRREQPGGRWSAAAKARRRAGRLRPPRASYKPMGEPEQKMPVTVAERGDGLAAEATEEGSSSWRSGAGRRATWPKRRPSTSPEEEVKRWMIEARVGPEMEIFSTGVSSAMAIEK